MNELLVALLRRLEAVADRDESLFDTYVREKMNDAVFCAFLKPTPGYVLPDDYGMPEEENRLIKEALQQYTEAARILAPALGIDTFHKRLEAFQNLDVGTEKNTYDDFFGSCPPSQFDSDGNVIPE
jgi:hypothetical protein